MEPRNDKSQKAPEPGKEERKPRFQIVNLEERIAPCSVKYTYRGHTVHYHFPGKC